MSRIPVLMSVIIAASTLAVWAEENAVVVGTDGNGSRGVVIINGKRQNIASSSNNLSVRVENGKVTVDEGADNGSETQKRKVKLPARRGLDTDTAGISSKVEVKDGKTLVEVKDGDRVLKFEYGADENIKVSSSSVNGKTTVTIKGKSVDVSFNFDDEWNKQNKKKE